LGQAVPARAVPARLFGGRLFWSRLFWSRLFWSRLRSRLFWSRLLGSRLLGSWLFWSRLFGSGLFGDRWWFFPTRLLGSYRSRKQGENPSEQDWVAPATEISSHFSIPPTFEIPCPCAAPMGCW
jgi:hypothetical protein